MKNLIFISFLISFGAQAQFGGGSPSSLNTACKQDGFSCGECETGLQDDLNNLMDRITGGHYKKKEHWGDGKETSTNPSNIPMSKDVTLDKTLGDIIALFKKHNPVGDNRLNFVVIGESESLQASSVKNGKIYPRIMLKSPNSELMVTFNTDPEAKGYNTIEMMRWNGKQGRYEFQELNFGEKGEKPHVDATGTKCLECHKESPRPNWDTYRAWAGVVPSRDDMMEKHGDSSSFDLKSGMQPDAKAYLNFLDQLASDKDSGKKTRLAMLDVPFDDKRQLKDYVARAGGKPLTSREKVDLIKKKIDDTGFYRIKHFPDKDEAEEKNSRQMSFNFDGKTAEWAGPSQFAFDQMLAQNMCKVTTDLRKHKDYDKFKYGLALLYACGKKGQMNEVYPPEFQNKILNYYSDSNYSSLQDIDRSKIPQGRTNDIEAMRDLISQDTDESHKAADGFKFNRHERFLNKFLTSVERMPASEASEKARFYSEEVVTPTQDYFHAIGDEGGVRGVPEDSTEIMSDTRMLLEPFGIKVGHWSLVHGKSNAYNSFSFSDQFELLRTQPLWDELKEEAGGSCSDLERKAQSALSIPAAAVPRSPQSDDVPELALLCGSQGQGVSDSLNNDNISDITKVAMEDLKPAMKASMKKCMGCHDTDGDIEFPGLSKFVKSDDEKEFLDFLGTKNDFYNRPMLEVIQIKLGLIPRPKDQDFGSPMPPTDWKDNAQFATQHEIPGVKAQDFRRKQLALYLTFATSGGRRDKIRNLCNQINNSGNIKEITGPSTQESQGHEAGAQ